MPENDATYSQPSDAFVRSIDVLSLLPQQPPFVMIGRLEHFDMTHVSTSTIIQADNIFVENGKFTAAGIIENIAQTCAARIGYINVYILKKGVQIGFIGAIRNLSINALPNVGDTIFTSIEIKEEVFGMLLVSAEVKVGDLAIATTEMKIAVKES